MLKGRLDSSLLLMCFACKLGFTNIICEPFEFSESFAAYEEVKIKHPNNSMFQQ